jgi:anti-sigma regulatory factor (Ser/Thr protein kinase)
MTTWTTQLPRDPAAPLAARLAVQEHAGDLGAHARDVELLVSELVSNAVRHGEAPVSLDVRREDDVLRVEVQDAGTGPGPRMRPGDRGGGFGLRLVDRVATRWGVERGSTRVWFELDLAVPPRRP